MTSKSLAIATAFLGLSFLAGCTGSRMSTVDTRPAPLTPAPSGTVVAGQLPPPSSPGATDPSQFPPPPAGPGATAATGTEDGETDVAALPPAQPAAPPPGAAQITPGGVAGVWNVSVAGQSCRVATPQTRFGQGFRAGPLGCPAPLNGLKSWNVSGSQLAFYDENGDVLARLYSTGGERYDGQTSTGQPISLSR